MIEDDIASEVKEYQKRIRDQIEHPKTHVYSFLLGWKYEGGESGPLYSLEDDHAMELFLQKPIDWAKKALLLYFRLCDSLYKWRITKFSGNNKN